MLLLACLNTQDINILILNEKFVKYKFKSSELINIVTISLA